jgi:hypothetical protein
MPILLPVSVTVRPVPLDCRNDSADAAARILQIEIDGFH